MRIAVLSDIHANLPALDATLASLGTVDEVWHLGDVVGYGPEPDAVVERLVEIGARGVRGNHDAAAVGGSEIEYFNPDARRAMEWTRSVISADTRRWLDGLPERMEIEGYTLVHGSPRDPIWEYVTSTGVARENLHAFQTRWCLHGHTHVPVVFEADGDRIAARRPVEDRAVRFDGGGATRALVNPGSVGQPRDGIPTASHLLIDTATGGLTWRRVPYDIAETQERMRRASLPPRLVYRLEVGR